MWEYDEQGKREERGYLDETAKRVGKELGKTVTPALLLGEVPAAVDEYVKAHGVGLVVVGAHRRRGLLGLGSETVEDALLHHTDLPVLIVPPEAEFPLRGRHPAHSGPIGHLGEAAHDTGARRRAGRSHGR